jgi:hypothetical protein
LPSCKCATRINDADEGPLAANEADVLSEAQAFFAEHPEYDFPGGRDGTTIRIGIVGGDVSIFSPDVIQAPKPKS